MQNVATWKRFRPHRRGKLSDQTVYEDETIYTKARQIVDETLHQVRSINEKDHSVLARTTRASSLLRRRDTHDDIHLLALLLLQTPAAARAQDDMEKHRGGYRNREARLFELIDFNDTFVDTVLALDAQELDNFVERLRHEQDVLCSRLGVGNFSEKQYEAIVHGLSREIAVYLGAKIEGFLVRMTSRAQDARGIDMIITDPRTKKSINVDVKTHSAFHFRLVDLERRRKLDEEDRLRCELAGFCRLRSSHHDDGIHTVLMRIATDRLGEIYNFRFIDTKPLGVLIADAIDNEGEYLI